MVFLLSCVPRQYRAFLGEWHVQNTDIDSTTIISQDGTIATYYDGVKQMSGTWNYANTNEIQIEMRILALPVTSSAAIKTFSGKIDNECLVLFINGRFQKYVRVSSGN